MKYDIPDFDINAGTSHTLVFNRVHDGDTVLEFGPATGYMTKALNTLKGCKMYLVEIDEEAGKVAGQFAEDAYMKPRELKTITDLEKVIGKKRFNELCGEWIDKPQGKPTLVPESDKRPELSGDDFANVSLSE